MDLYRVLGVESSASRDQIKLAYYDLAKRYHPDSTGNHSENEGSLNRDMFQQVQMAYEILSCNEKRGDYDRYRGRSYYENQYGSDQEGQGDGRKGPYSSDWFKSKEQGFDRDKQRARYTGNEWYWLTPSQLLVWGALGVLSNNLYERWHLNQLQKLRDLAFKEQMHRHQVISCRI